MTTFTETHLNTKAKISALLAERGWVPFSSDSQSYTSGIAEKSYKTAVGTKTAVAYFNPSRECVGLMLAQYDSEGRNALSTVWHPVAESTTEADLVSIVDRYVAQIDKAVGQTYAMKLMG